MSETLVKYASLKTERQIHTLEEVEKHVTSSDLWMVIYDKVYNITTFLDLHPGGAEVLFDCSGVDATAAFEDVCHSNDAIKMLKPYLVGHLDLLQVKFPPKPLDDDVEASDPGEKKRRSSLSHTARHKRYIGKRKHNVFGKSFLKGRGNIAGLTVLATFAFAGYVFIQWKKWTDWSAA
ncbi:hypothetical protein BABINDRAFT_162748 [Babjeviella inositovora NRRL Y-12698]|uniref:Cytochrome b5 heme-binding domain-containing protein n=1 Tax=Babjeviella inositovora NRRL Y-12698 TaxID=984486 RepID=A0A1E3QLK7_9ASCO|nr:uncharacterized protein BABINDRAFT_162748 [Babjeviella inositovora NRRL Y-12698]ODQ78540.1 hypothetical protein BABINDRAFT_162748 [Babjeviella inositovora NRRL Y-12698]